MQELVDQDYQFGILEYSRMHEYIEVLEKFHDCKISHKPFLNSESQVSSGRYKIQFSVSHERH